MSSNILSVFIFLWLPPKCLNKVHTLYLIAVSLKSSFYSIRPPSFYAINLLKSSYFKKIANYVSSPSVLQHHFLIMTCFSLYPEYHDSFELAFIVPKMFFSSFVQTSQSRLIDDIWRMVYLLSGFALRTISPLKNFVMKLTCWRPRVFYDCPFLNFKSHFKSWVYKWRGRCNTRDINPLSDTWFASIFSHSINCPFTLLFVPQNRVTKKQAIFPLLLMVSTVLQVPPSPKSTFCPEL